MFLHLAKTNERYYPSGFDIYNVQKGMHYCKDDSPSESDAVLPGRHTEIPEEITASFIRIDSSALSIKAANLSVRLTSYRGAYERSLRPC